MSHFPHPHARRGLALVIVLAFIALLSILVVGFIAFNGMNRTTTASYSESVAAQEIASGGLEDILSDLSTEIQAGSFTNQTIYAANGGAMVYVPTNNFAASPARAGYDLSSWGNDYNSPSADYLPPTLIRVSRRSQDGTPTDFYPNFCTNGYFDPTLIANLLNRASPANTASLSANNRYISPARWNKIFLLAPTTATNTASSYGNSAIPGAFATNYTSSGDPGLANGSVPPYGPPDWVYVTRTGSRVCANSEIAQLIPSNVLGVNYGPVTPGANPPASPIIGRYAFVVYDEGSLLDANVAGYTHQSANMVSSPDPTTGVSQDTIEKSYSSYANLTNIGLSQSFVDSLVTYRNASANPTDGNSYLTSVGSSYGKTGFLFFTNSSNGTDSPFLTRQDLINYFAQNDANFNTRNALPALPRLGTFSRDANTPSYYPTSDSAGITNYLSGSTQTNLYYGTSSSYGYHTYMETAGYPNRDLANIRYAAPATVNHYDDSAMAHTYKVAQGDIFLQSRFSLAKINWLSQTWAGQPDPGTDNGSYAGSKYPTAIQACFGLVWDYPAGVAGTQANGGNKCWNYVGSTSPTTSASGLQSVTGVQIETLDQVAAEGREPNFFELLKAAILNGSLGKSPGIPAWNNGQLYSAGVYGPSQSLGGNTYGNYDIWDADSVVPARALSGSANLFAYSYDGHRPGVAPTAFAPYQYTDCQIIQIGANIISQFSSDSYPTAIYFKYGGEGSFDSVNTGNTAVGAPNCPIYGPVNIFYGDENLPEISGLSMDDCSTNAITGGNPITAQDWFTDPSGGTTTISGFVQPVLWNPHQQPNTALFPSSGQKYEMRAYGAMDFAWYWGGGPPPNWPAGIKARAAYGAPTIWYTSNSSSEANADGTIYFSDATNTSSFYSRPYVLTYDSIPAYGNSAVSVVQGIGPGKTSPNNVAQSTSPYYNLVLTNHFAGFHVSTSYATNSPDGTEEEFYTGTNGVSFTTYFRPSNQCGGGTQALFCNAYALGWVDSNGGFHPYSFLPGTFCWEEQFHQMSGGISDNSDGNVFSRLQVSPGSEKSYGYDTIDSRTLRFPQIFDDPGRWHMTPGDDNDSQPSYSTSGHRSSRPMNGLPYAPYNIPNGPGYGFYGNTPPASTNSLPLSDYQVNTIWSAPAQGTVDQFWPHAFYADPDGVVRPGDGYYSNPTTGDGRELFIDPSGNGSPKGAYALGDFAGNVSHGRRPVILNRPFRSVGELGYTFRDLPFKTLDFFSQSSADAALLDVFSITDETSVNNNKLSAMVAGHVNLNNAPVPVIMALLYNGAKKEDFDTNYYMTAEVPEMSTNICTLLNPTNAPPLGPILNRANIVTTLMAGNAPANTNAPGNVSILASFANSVDIGNKPYFEAPARALSSVTNTRTWNLLIDIIAQSGHLVPNATSLDNFSVDSEKRYWLHIAIDRYTGRIIDQQLEPVYE